MRLLILSDRGVDQEWAPIPTLLACSGVHHHLVREGTRTRAGLVIESGELENDALALLTGYGAGAINPYVASRPSPNWWRMEKWRAWMMTIIRMYIKAINKGLLKDFSKCGISTLQSFIGVRRF